MTFRNRRIRFKAKDLERSRRYWWGDEYVRILHDRLKVKPGQTIIDVGCGTGFFTRLLAKRLAGKGRVMGYDINESFLKVARRLANQENLGDAVTFHKGNASDLPLPDNAADRIVCQTLLWTLKEPRAAIREMVRVCKSGGIVGAIEGAFDFVVMYVPDDARLTELYQKWVVAYADGHRKIYGSDRGIGYKLPAMFAELGLKRVHLDGFPYVWLESDERVPREFRLEEHRITVRRHQRPDKKEKIETERILQAGGMTKAEIYEMRGRSYERSRRILQYPARLEKDFSMNAGLFLLTTGVKTQS